MISHQRRTLSGGPSSLSSSSSSLLQSKQRLITTFFAPIKDDDNKSTHHQRGNMKKVLLDTVRLIFISAMIFNIGMTAYKYFFKPQLSYETFSEANFDSIEYEDEVDDDELVVEGRRVASGDMQLLPPLQEEVVVNDISGNSGGQKQNNVVVNNKAVVTGSVAAPINKETKEVKTNLRKKSVEKSDASNVELVLNPGFESKLSPHWTAKFKTMSIRLDKKVKHSGKSSVLVKERKATAHGIVQDLLLSKKGLLRKKKRATLVKGTYRISCWAKLKNSSTKDTIQMIVKYVDDDGVHNTNPMNAMGIVNDKEWTLVQGVVNIRTNGTLSVAKLFIEGPKAGVDFYVDDVSFKLVEDGVAGAAAVGGSKESTIVGRKTLSIKNDDDAKAPSKEEKVDDAQQAAKAGRRLPVAMKGAGGKVDGQK